LNLLSQLLKLALSFLAQAAAAGYLVWIAYWLAFGMGNGTGLNIYRWPPPLYIAGAGLVAIAWIAVGRWMLRSTPTAPQPTFATSGKGDAHALD
jgi:hypothetical protein